MSSLRYAAKMLFRQQQIAANFARAISTSAPKSNFGNHEVTTINESAMRIDATQLLGETNEEGSDKSSNKSDDKKANVPKPASKHEMPAMTIVDINSGNRSMDFEDRMHHMDIVEHLNNTKLHRSVEPMMPLIRDLPTVVDIDGFNDDVKYEDEHEVDVLPEVAPSVAPTSETVESNELGGSANTVPFTDGAQQAPDRPQRTSGDGTVKAAGAAAERVASQIKENICIAPVDIDAFLTEDEDRVQGTVDINAFGDADEEEEDLLTLPPIPAVRNNVFEFKGIKVMLPKRMLRDETYRYCLEPTDKDMPDDMHVCVFEK